MAYIEGAQVTVATNHQLLKWVMSLKIPDQTAGTMGDTPAAVKPGDAMHPWRGNVLADLLSRLSQTTCEEEQIEIANNDILRSATSAASALILRKPEKNISRTNSSRRLLRPSKRLLQMKISEDTRLRGTSCQMVSSIDSRRITAGKNHRWWYRNFMVIMVPSMRLTRSPNTTTALA